MSAAGAGRTGSSLDLSGFTAVAAPPLTLVPPAAPAAAAAPTSAPPASAPPASAPVTPSRAPAPRSAAPRPAAGVDGVRRLSLNVPAAVLEAAHDRARAEGVYLADVVVEALATHGAAVEATAAARPGRRGPAERRRRQRAVHHPTQLVVALSARERADLDAAATRTGLSRSAFVTALLVTALAPAEEATADG
jgi:hypothetical protein